MSVVAPKHPGPPVFRLTPSYLHMLRCINNHLNCSLCNVGDGYHPFVDFNSLTYSPFELEWHGGGILSGWWFVVVIYTCCHFFRLIIAPAYGTEMQYRFDIWAMVISPPA